MTSKSRPWALYVYATLVYLFLFAPIVMVVLNSFNADQSLVGWGGFTLQWYQAAMQNSVVTDAAKTSVVIAVTVAVLSAMLGTGAAVVLQRSKGWLRLFLEGSSYARIIMPELVLALSLLIFLSSVGIARGTATIVIGHVVFNSAYVTVIVAARLAARDAATEEAARDLGATPWRAFRRVTLPQIMPGVIAGALLAFTFSLENVVTSFFLSGSTNTLPLVILSLIRYNVSPMVNAIGTGLMIVTGSSMMLFLLLNWRWTVGAQRQTRVPVAA